MQSQEGVEWDRDGVGHSGTWPSLSIIAQLILQTWLLRGRHLFLETINKTKGSAQPLPPFVKLSSWVSEEGQSPDRPWCV